VFVVTIMITIVEVDAKTNNNMSTLVGVGGQRTASTSRGHF